MTDQPLLTIPDREYWKPPLESLQEVLESRLGEGVPGPAVAMPSRVPLEGRDTLPVCGCYVEPLGKSNRTFQELAVVVASCHDNGKLYAANAYPAPAFIEDIPPPSTSPPPKGWAGILFDFDLYRSLPNLPRRPATYDVAVIVKGQVSNRHRVQLTGSGVLRDPEVRRFIEEHHRKKGLPSAFPPSAGVLPGHDSPELPVVPGKIGISLQSDRVALLADVPRCRVAGAYRVPVPNRYSSPSPASTDTASIHAMVPINLLLTASDFAGALQVPLRIPCYSPLGPGDPFPIAVGRFAFDLFSLPGIWKEPRICFLHAFSGAAASDPAKVAFVTSEMLED